MMPVDVDYVPRGLPTRVILADALRTVRRIMGMEVAFVSEFTDGERVFREVDSDPDFTPICVGDGDPLEESYCQRVVDGRLPEIIPDATANAEACTLAATRALPVGAHLSVPLRFPEADRVFGTFCCFSREADESLNERDLNTMRLFADFLGQLLERREAENLELEALRQDLQAVIDTGSFRTVFQPIVDTRAGRVAGFEALTRFPEALGRAPDIVFAEAASVGLEEALEDRTLRSALTHLPALPEDAYLSLNSSPPCVLDGSVLAAVEDAPLERLVLEVTEHSSIEDYSALAAALAPLRAKEPVGASTAAESCFAPSPAMSLVLLATCRTSCAPMFSNLSLNSMFLATVTPSFVILGAPYGWSRIAFRPFGPKVTLTASASWSTPLNMSALPSVPKLISLPLMALACLASGRAPRLSKGCILSLLAAAPRFWERLRLLR